MQWTLGSPIVKMDFRTTDTVVLDTLSYGMRATLTNANICDENGNLLYITNGILIADKYGDTLLDGYGLSPCYYTSQYLHTGLNIAQGALFLPMPGNPRYYYLIHFSNDTVNDSRPKAIYYSLIDKEGNFGLGRVIEKNIPILDHVVLREGGLTACKHANGRDYWIVMPGRSLNMFYKFLLTPYDFYGPFTQNIGGFYPGPFDVAYSKFSADGSKYATGAYSGDITVLDFDRCTGEFSNPILIYNESSLDPINHPLSGSASLEFSPTGRFLYVTTRLDIRQYDLWSVPKPESKDIYISDSLDIAQVRYLQLAPNGKIYVSTWHGGFRFVHVIHNPDNKGDSAQFKYGDQVIPTRNGHNLSNLINYKLGALAGSGCDTIKTSIEQHTANTKQLRLQPNPADKFVYIEMLSQGDYELQLLNEMGQLIQAKHTRQVNIFNTEDLPSGVYFINVIDKRNNTQLSTDRVVVRH